LGSTRVEHTCDTGGRRPGETNLGDAQVEEKKCAMKRNHGNVERGWTTRGGEDGRAKGLIWAGGELEKKIDKGKKEKWQ